MSETRGLTLSLKPNEKFLVGGNLLQNGPRKGSIRIADESVYVLRLSDALHPDEIRTPVTRAYHAAQMILACEVAPEIGRRDLIERLDQLIAIFRSGNGLESLVRARAAAEVGRYHGVLIGLRATMPFEAELLSRDDGTHTHEEGYPIAVGAR